MVLSKGKKLILIAVVAVIILVAGFFIYRSHSETQYDINLAVDRLLDEDFLFMSVANPYDEETVAVFIEDFWNPLKDKSAFQKELVNRLTEGVIEPAFHNLNEQRTKQEDHNYIENRYGDVSLSAHNIILKLVGFLSRVGYEDSELKESFTNYYQRLAEINRTSAPAIAGYPEQERELSLAEDLIDTLEGAAEFNQAAGDFYQIPTDQVATADEIAKHCDQAIQLSQEVGDRVTFAGALSAASTSTILEGQNFIEPNQIMTFLMDTSGKWLTLKNENGGYYDTHPLKRDERIGKVIYYGDFAKWAPFDGGDRYDTSALDGVWDALTPEQQAEIEWANRDSETTYYLQGERYDGSLDESLEDEDYGYVYLNTDGYMLYLSRDSILYSGDKIYRDTIYGDFSGIYEDVEQDFQAEHPTFETGAVTLTEEPYATYTGTFQEKTGRWNFTIYSEFWLYNDEVYWLPREPINLRSDGTLVQSFFTEPTLLEDMAAEGIYGQVTATVTFVDGTVHFSMKENDTIVADYDLVKGD